MNELPKTKSGWRILRRILIGCAILATLVAIFYTEENWRGKRAWENCKRELEAKGAVLDWNAYIPPPVPDAQNFFTASPKITASFIKARNDVEGELATRLGIHLGPSATNFFPVFDNHKGKPVVVARLTILTSSVKFEPANTNLIFKLNDPAASEQIGKLIQKAAGRSANGSQGFQFSEMQLSNLVPAQIFVVADSTPSISDLENFNPPDTATNIGRLQVEATIEKGIFQIVLTGVHITSAADYLKWSGQYESDFNEIREALKRPCAIIPGDYSEPYLMPIPNFVMLRALAQTLAQRTQCYLLLDQPDKALQELTLMHDVCRILERPPAGKPIALVEAMINVAISGVYIQTVADGMRLHAWQEPQLAAIQEQLRQLNLLPIVAESFQEGRVYASRSLETVTAAKFKKWFSFGQTKKSEIIWEQIKGLRFYLIPRGWIYQNMRVATQLEGWVVAGYDLTNGLLLVPKIETAQNELKLFETFSPYNFLAAMVIPNYVKASQSFAYNQTLANEAQIVCALERYHFAHGEYPETLDALAPQFMEKIPHDIIGGEPLHYRRTEDRKFLLYSVGWNETDDGGLPGTLADVKKGDWVWQYPVK